MDLGQDLRQVAIALVGDDDRGAGLGDQEIGAGDADIGIEVFLAQHLPRLLDQRGDFGQVALGVEMRVRLAEIASTWSRVRCTAGAMMWLGRSLAELDQVLAEIGLDRRDAIGFEMMVEVDLLGDHRLALGDRAWRLRPRQMPRMAARASSAVAAQCTWPPAAIDLLLVALEIEIEMCRARGS